MFWSQNIEHEIRSVGAQLVAHSLWACANAYFSSASVGALFGSFSSGGAAVVAFITASYARRRDSLNDAIARAQDETSMTPCRTANYLFSSFQVSLRLAYALRRG